MNDIRTERLVLRMWRQSDLAPWAAMNADPDVRKHFGDLGFESLGLPEILALTTVDNVRSQAVMRRIGMTHDPAENFDDPTVSDGPLTRNVLYRIARSLSARPAWSRPE